MLSIQKDNSNLLLTRKLPVEAHRTVLNRMIKTLDNRSDNHPDYRRYHSISLVYISFERRIQVMQLVGLSDLQQARVWVTWVVPRIDIP